MDMPRSTKRLLILTFVGALVACSTARNPARGFRLADNGDIQRGKAAFLEFGCNACHEVRGAYQPSPAAKPVSLGGSVTTEPSDGYLVTAIINPKYHAAHYPATPGGPPGMPDYTSRMTVQQLTDLVAYLQSRYTIRPVQARGEYN